VLNHVESVKRKTSSCWWKAFLGPWSTPNLGFTSPDYPCLRRIYTLLGGKVKKFHGDIPKWDLRWDTYSINLICWCVYTLSSCGNFNEPMVVNGDKHWNLEYLYPICRQTHLVGELQVLCLCRSFTSGEKRYLCMLPSDNPELTWHLWEKNIEVLAEVFPACAMFHDTWGHVIVISIVGV